MLTHEACTYVIGIHYLFRSLNSFLRICLNISLYLFLSACLSSPYSLLGYEVCTYVIVLLGGQNSTIAKTRTDTVSVS